MNKLFSTLFSSLRAKFTGLWTKLRLMTSLTWWRTKVFTKLRQLFAKLFDIKPRHKKDYYPVFRWLVSKRLAFALVIVLGLASVYYISLALPEDFFGGGGTVRTYRYKAIPLRFTSGEVGILAEDGYLAYVGQVDEGYCAGVGTLYDEQGAKIYQGDFATSKYHGSGQLFWPDGTLRYEGGFAENLFAGQGEYFRQNGSLEYRGEHLAGDRHGQGELFNAAANPIFAGTFRLNEIVYSEFLGKPTGETAQMYTGDYQVFSGAEEYAVSMEEIGAVYGVTGGADTLEGEWTINNVCVLANSFPVENRRLSGIAEAIAFFGQPDYQGVADVNLTEAVAVNLLARENDKLLGRVRIESTATLEDVFEVTSYADDYEIYLYAFVSEGLTYTFYTTGRDQQDFVMYAIELA